jgi:hypothetical protein
MGSRRDRLLHLPIAKSGNVAVTLQALLVEIHGQGHVDREHQLEIDEELGQSATGKEERQGHIGRHGVKTQLEGGRAWRASHATTLAWRWRTEKAIATSSG